MSKVDWAAKGQTLQGEDEVIIANLTVLASSACGTYTLHRYTRNDKAVYSLFPGKDRHEFTGPGFAMQAAETLNMDCWLQGDGTDVYQPIVWIRTSKEN